MISANNVCSINQFADLEIDHGVRLLSTLLSRKECNIHAGFLVSDVRFKDILPDELGNSVSGARAVRSATLNVPQAHAGGNQAEKDTVLTSAGALGEARNIMACDH